MTEEKYEVGDLLVRKQQVYAAWTPTYEIVEPPDIDARKYVLRAGHTGTYFDILPKVLEQDYVKVGHVEISKEDGQKSNADPKNLWDDVFKALPDDLKNVVDDMNKAAKRAWKDTVSIINDIAVDSIFKSPSKK